MNELFKELSVKEKEPLFTKETIRDLAEGEIQELWLRARQAETVSKTLDNMFDEKKSASELSFSRETLHNMNVIGMDRLLKMHPSHTTESNVHAMMGIGAFVAFIIGVYFKFFEFSSELVSSNSKSIESAIKKIDEDIEHYKERWSTKLNVVSIKKDEESKKTFETEIKEQIDKLESNTGSMLIDKIVKGDFTFAGANDVIGEISDRNKAIKQIIPDLISLTKSLMELEKETDLGTKPEHHDKLEKFSQSVLAFIQNKDHIARLGMEKLIIDVYKHRYRLTIDSNFPFSTPENLADLRENILFIKPIQDGMKVLLKQDSVNKTISVRRLATLSIKTDNKNMDIVTRELVDSNSKVMEELAKMEEQSSKLADIIKSSHVPQESDVMKEFKKAVDNYKLSINIVKDYISVLANIIALNDEIRIKLTKMYASSKKAEVIVYNLDRAKEWMNITV